MPDEQPPDQQPDDLLQQFSDQQDQLIDQQPIDLQSVDQVQTVVLSDEQFALLISQSTEIQTNQIWLIACLAFIAGAMVIQAFFTGWRSTK